MLLRSPWAENGCRRFREVHARYDLTAKKSLGQNFLFDLNLTPPALRAVLRR